MTPRPPASAAWATALAITSGSGVDSTCATEGAVRLQPVSRWVGNLDDISQRGYRLARSKQRTRRLARGQLAATSGFGTRRESIRTGIIPDHRRQPGVSLKYP